MYNYTGRKNHWSVRVYERAARVRIFWYTPDILEYSGCQDWTNPDQDLVQSGLNQLYPGPKEFKKLD